MPQFHKFNVEKLEEFEPSILIAAGNGKHLYARVNLKTNQAFYEISDFKHDTIRLNRLSDAVSLMNEPSW